MTASVEERPSGAETATASGVPMKGPSPVVPETTASVETGGGMSSRSREELWKFISTSVLPQTRQVYSKEFVHWNDCVESETGSDDPFLTGMTDNDKAALVSLIMMRRHQGSQRGKAAASFTAAIRLMVARAMLSTGFLYSAIIATTRTSCLMS
jgi:hypothetical protein